MKAFTIGAAGLLMLLAGCGGSGEESGLTAEESKQLNEAAEMLDASPDSLVAPDGTGLGNGEAGSNEEDAALEANATENAATNAQ